MARLAGVMLAALVAVVGDAGPAHTRTLTLPPTDLVADLDSRWQIEVRAASAEELAHSIDADRAVGIAGGQAFLGRDEARTAYLVRFTDRIYARVRDDEDAGELIHVDHLAWLVVARGASVPRLGPPGRADTPPFARVTMSVFLDAVDGRFLNAVSSPASVGAS